MFVVVVVVVGVACMLFWHAGLQMALPLCNEACCLFKNVHC